AAVGADPLRAPALQVPLRVTRPLAARVPHLVRAHAQGIRDARSLQGRAAGARDRRPAGRAGRRRRARAGGAERVFGNRDHARVTRTKCGASGKQRCRSSRPSHRGGRAHRATLPASRVHPCAIPAANRGSRDGAAPHQLCSPAVSRSALLHLRLAVHISEEERSNSMAKSKQPNFLVMWGDDIGQSNLSCYTKGMMGYRTPNIDRIAKEGMIFTDAYAEQSCTAGRASFITGQCGLRTGLTKVGLPGADLGLKAEDITIAEALKPLGYRTGQFGKNHLGDRDEHLPTMHGFDEFFGNLYHLNAEEEPEQEDYPDPKEFPEFRKKYGPRGVLHCWADGKGGQ